VASTPPQYVFVRLVFYVIVKAFQWCVEGLGNTRAHWATSIESLNKSSLNLRPGRAASNEHREANHKPNVVSDAHSSISTSACVVQLKALSSEVLLHGDIHDQHFGDGIAREALDKGVPPFKLLLERLGCLQLSINPGIVVNCNLLEGPTKLLMVVANCFGNSRCSHRDQVLKCQ